MACGTQRPGAVGKSPMRIPYSELFAGLLRVLLKLGFEQQRARLCAQLFADASRDGVYSHGLNRFPQFVRMIQTGVIAVDAEPELVASWGSLERWNGRSGPGNLNAYRSMDRAIALSRERGIGCVALANTNHWMRGGSYGWAGRRCRCHRNLLDQYNGKSAAVGSQQSACRQQSFDYCGATGERPCGPRYGHVAILLRRSGLVSNAR